MSARVLVVLNEESDPAGLVGNWLEERGVEVDVVHAYAGEAVPVEVPEGYSGLLAFGGYMGANDDDEHPWLTQERALLKSAAESDVPVFGVCLGGQLLATAIGGTVERTPQIEIGVVDMQVSADATGDPVFGSIAGRTVASSQWHQDYISALPAEAHVLMSNEACPVQAFRVGKAAYGVQFHPEVDAVAFKQWATVSDEAGERSGIDVMAAADEVAAREDELAQTWRPIFHAFADLVRSV